jgi:hypothetical protein
MRKGNRIGFSYRSLQIFFRGAELTNAACEKKEPYREKPVMINAQLFWQNWQNGMNNSADRMRQGVAAVKTAPSEGAIAAKEKMRARWIQSIDTGKWASRTAEITLQQWQQAMIQKGIPRIADGVRGAQARVINFATQLLAYEMQLQQQVRAMPKITVADSKARMNAWFDGMQQFQYQRGSILQ